MRDIVTVYNLYAYNINKCTASLDNKSKMQFYGDHADHSSNMSGVGGGGGLGLRKRGLSRK